MKHLFLNFMVIFIIGTLIGCVKSVSDTKVTKNSSEQARIAELDETIARPDEEPKVRGEEKVAKNTQLYSVKENKNASLKTIAGSGNSIEIDLTNSVPVRGVQFTLEGVKIIEVRTTSRTAGFLAKFNEESGIVIMVSTSGDKIIPGTGPIAEIMCDKRNSANLTGIKIANN